MGINIQFRQVDPSAKQDSLPSAADAQPWSDLSIFGQDDFSPATLPNVMTLEHNQAILDDTMDEFPENPFDYEWGLWTSTQSGSDGMFDAPPIIDVEFGNIHKSRGVTLFFHPWSQDWASSIRVTWFADDLITIIKSGTYDLTGTTSAAQEPVDGYRRILIEFLKTNIPYRFIKLWHIEYGVIRMFEDGDIDTADALEEVDPISDILSVNTFGFTVKTHNPVFSPISGDIGDEMIMTRQSMDVVVDEKLFGRFFLETWKDRYSDGVVFDFQAMDAIGVMDGYRFMGDIYVDVLASDILDQLFELCFPTKLIRYQLDGEFTGVRVTGHIPICTAREALQYVCFAIGAVADTSRRDYVWIYRREISHIQDARISVNDIQPFGRLGSPERRTSGPRPTAKILTAKTWRRISKWRTPGRKSRICSEKRRRTKSWLI